MEGLGEWLRAEERFEAVVGAAVHSVGQLQQHSSFLIGEAPKDATGELSRGFSLFRVVGNPIHINKGIEGRAPLVFEPVDTGLLLDRFWCKS